MITKFIVALIVVLLTFVIWSKLAGTNLKTYGGFHVVHILAKGRLERLDPAPRVVEELAPGQGRQG